MLTVRQVHMRKIKEIEMATELNRFKNGFLKLGKNKKIETLTAGCVVLVNLKDHTGPEMVVEQSLERCNVTVRLRNRLLTTSVGVCIPITKEPQSQSVDSAQSKNNIWVGEQITHFISLDLSADKVVKSIQAL